MKRIFQTIYRKKIKSLCRLLNYLVIFNMIVELLFFQSSYSTSVFFLIGSFYKIVITKNQPYEPNYFSNPI